MKRAIDIQVEVLNCVDDSTAIATASALLAYCDSTNTFGYVPQISNVEVQHDGDGPIAVTITADMAFADERDLDDFMFEMRNISKVLDVELA